MALIVGFRAPQSVEMCRAGPTKCTALTCYTKAVILGLG